NLADVINSSINELQRLSKDENACSFHLDLQATELTSDPMRIKIIAHNLVSNAIKFRDHKKESCSINIRTRKNDKSLILEVEDNGIGIEPKYLNKVWDMFFRGTSDHLGSGLGLYILKESAKAVGAEVGVKSNYGLGSVFTVSFPLTIKEASSNRPSIDSSLLQD
ncbi:MAG: HAMP domain-containing sensor histidine kinase, partial [Flavobacteriales bacterium]